MTNEFIPGVDKPADSEQILLELAGSFDSNEARRSVLHSYQKGIILLRAKNATYNTIVEFLEKIGVKSSVFSVAHFCRKYRSEINKVRKELKKGKAVEEPQKVVSSNPRTAANHS
jgi:hypothetical protein